MDPLLLLSLLLLKHFVADFPGQTTWMVRGKGQAVDWLAPLVCHAAFHAVLTGAILAVAVNPRFALVAASVELFAHAGIDRLKASPRFGGRWTPAQPPFWWALGLDQLAHQACYVAIVAAI